MKAINSAIVVGLLRGLALALCLAAPAWGQRMQFASMLDEGAGAVSPPVVSSPPSGFSAAPGSTFAPPPSAAPLTSGSGFDPYAAPSLQSAPPFTPPGSAPVYGAPTYGAPSYTAPAYSPYGAPAPYSPYAPSPYSPTPGALYPDGFQTPQWLPQNFSIQEPIRFMQEVRGRATWLSPMGSQFLGVTDVETSATFAVPFFRTSAPFLVTPGFGIHWFDGPVTTPATGNADLPPRTYEAYLDGAWHPQVTPWLGANLGVRVGAYTDFNTFTTHSIRIMGRGLGVVTFTPTLQFALGVVYIDRVLVKILPAGGLIWIPNPDARYEILFPNPKLARRWTTIGNTDVWFYVTGEYGGGSWTIQRINGLDQADYNDIRVALGIESYGHRGLHAQFEVGYVFDRQIVYRSGTPQYDPSDTIMLRLALSY